MADTLQDILASRNLIGRVVDVVNGVPEKILPPAFATATRTTEGNRGEYLRVAGTRQTATVCRYGAPAANIAPAGIGQTPVTLLHSFESFPHDPTTLLLLIEESGTGLVRQQMAKETINRQLDVFGQRFKNLRISSIFSALATGGIGFDSKGNLLPPDTGTALINSGAAYAVNFGVPVGNTGKINPFGATTGGSDGAGNTFANWVYNPNTNPTPNILNQLLLLQEQAVEFTGYPLEYAFYGKNIPRYIANDPVLQSIIRGSSKVAEQTLLATIPDSVGGLKWVQANTAHYYDQNGIMRKWIGDNTIVFTPAPSTDWWEVIEGTYPVPRSIQLANDMAAVLGNIQQVAGPFSYAQITTNPVSLQHFAGDTFLPILKNPNVVFIANVPTS
jgi:hypothetical protein